MKCSDIPNEPILEFLKKLDGTPASLYSDETIVDKNISICHCMPPGTPEKLRLAKMRRLIERGLVEGCACGCRGDFLLKKAEFRKFVELKEKQSGEKT